MYFHFFVVIEGTFIYINVSIATNMPKSPDKSTVIENQGKIIITIPKPLAEAHDLKAGQKVLWKTTGKRKLEAEFL